MERVGVFGGTFDPVHVGHLVAAVWARAALRLDRVLLVVANEPWQKSDRSVTAAEDRYAMVRAALAGREGLEASRIEIDRGGPSYTAETLEELAAGGERDLFLVVGADVADDLGTWERPDVVRRLATVAVVDRPGVEEVELGPDWRVEHVATPHLDVSGSALRARAAAGLPLDGLVPDAVIRVIRERDLYAGA